MSDLQPSAPVPVPEQALVVIGDITISKSWLVTPVGSRPLAGTEIFVTDFSRTETKIPTWAVVLAILGAFFSYSAFFSFSRVRRSRSAVSRSACRKTIWCTQRKSRP